MTVIVQDPSGAILPDAALELRDRGTNDVRNGSTQQSGAYTFPNLPFGGYQLTATAPGFQKELFESLQGSNWPCYGDPRVGEGRRRY